MPLAFKWCASFSALALAGKTAELTAQPRRRSSRCAAGAARLADRDGGRGARSSGGIGRACGGRRGGGGAAAELAAAPAGGARSRIRRRRGIAAGLSRRLSGFGGRSCVIRRSDGLAGGRGHGDRARRRAGAHGAGAAAGGFGPDSSSGTTTTISTTNMVAPTSRSLRRRSIMVRMLRSSRGAQYIRDGSRAQASARLEPVERRPHGVERAEHHDPIAGRGGRARAPAQAAATSPRP